MRHSCSPNTQLLRPLYSCCVKCTECFPPSTCVRRRDAWVALTLWSPHVTARAPLYELILCSCICWFHLLCACVCVQLHVFSMFFVFCSAWFTVHGHALRMRQAKVNKWNFWRMGSTVHVRSFLHQDGTPVRSSYQTNTSTAASSGLYPHTSMGLLHLQRIIMWGLFSTHLCVYFKQTESGLIFAWRYDNTGVWRGSGLPEGVAVKTLRSCFEFLFSNCPNIPGSWWVVLVSHMVGWKSTAVSQRICRIWCHMK